MATNVVQKENKDKKPLPLVVSEYLLRFRKIILTSIAVLSAIMIGIVVYSIVVEHKNTVATAKIEAIIEQWEKAKYEEEGNALTESEDRFLKELSILADKNKRLSSGARSNLISAEIYFSRKDWKNARDFYLACVKSRPSIYTAPIAYYNAAVCSEELGDPDSAIVQYRKAFDHDSFSQKPRALFNIGRIEEQRGNRDLAITTYEQLADQFPEDSWGLLAKSRIISLQIQ